MIKSENGYVIKYFLVPSIIVSLLLMIGLEQARLAGFIYFVFALFSVYVLGLERFQEDVYGLKKEFFAPLVVGVGTAVAFFVISSILPFFSLLTPSLPASVAANIRWFIIAFLAPVIEESWRSAMVGFLKKTYNLPFGFRVNIIQATIFSLAHITAYGIALGAYSHWIEAYGAIAAVSGSFLAAGTFGFLSGLMMNKFKNILPSIIAHIGINSIMLAQGYVIVMSIVAPLINHVTSLIL